MTDTPRPTPVEKIWAPPESTITPEASANLREFHPVMRQLLFNRGKGNLREAEDFLEARPPMNTDPFALLDMQKAIDRLEFAVKKGELIAVYGDYDADGVSATALMVTALQAVDANVRAYIPNRFDEGYGLNNEALSQLQNDGIQLVISVDCGIRSLDEAEHAKKIGLDLIISDHHTPGDQLPDALAVINPKRPGDPYPDKDLAGVGTAFKVASALMERMRPADFSVDSLLDLVAIGTVADLVPMVGENRYLVQQGLMRLQAAQRQGLNSLMGIAGIDPARVTATNIGFGIGPRLNAAGRLESAMDAYQLLTTKDVAEAGRLAQQLDNQNRERQALTREMQKLADAIAVTEGALPYLLFAAHADFNAGVVGLTAARLVEQYYRPAIVAHADEETTRGSCRSIPEFHITNALDQCADLLVHHGGHAAAAGFTVLNENRDALVSRLQAIAAEQLGELDLRPTLLADAEVKLSDLTFNLLQDLDRLQPTGYGNPDPLFIARDLKVAQSRTVGRDSSHLKLTLTDGSRTLMDAIAFRFGHWKADMPERVDVMFQFEKNEYQGRVSLQLNVRDMKRAG